MAAPKAGLVDDGIVADYPEDLYHYDTIAQGIEGFDKIGEGEIALFHQQGYLAVNNAFNAQEVQGALDGLLYLLSGANPDFTGVMYEHAAKGVEVESLPAEARQDYVRKFMWFVDHDARLPTMHSWLRCSLASWANRPCSFKTWHCSSHPTSGGRSPGTKIMPILTCP